MSYTCDRRELISHRDNGAAGTIPHLTGILAITPSFIIDACSVSTICNSVGLCQGLSRPPLGILDSTRPRISSTDDLDWWFFCLCSSSLSCCCRRSRICCWCASIAAVRPSPARVLVPPSPTPNERMLPLRLDVTAGVAVGATVGGGGSGVATDVAMAMSEDMLLFSLLCRPDEEPPKAPDKLRFSRLETR